MECVNSETNFLINLSPLLQTLAADSLAAVPSYFTETLSVPGYSIQMPCEVTATDQK